jgi:hypothetical protein
MSKWVNLYLFALAINIIVIFFSTSVILSFLLFALGCIVLFMSRENNTTSIVHIIMFVIGTLFFVGSIWRFIYG